MKVPPCDLCTFEDAAVRGSTRLGVIADICLECWSQVGVGDSMPLMSSMSSVKESIVFDEWGYAEIVTDESINDEVEKAISALAGKPTTIVTPALAEALRPEFAVSEPAKVEEEPPAPVDTRPLETIVAAFPPPPVAFFQHVKVSTVDTDTQATV